MGCAGLPLAWWTAFSDRGGDAEHGGLAGALEASVFTSGLRSSSSRGRSSCRCADWWRARAVRHFLVAMVGGSATGGARQRCRQVLRLCHGKRRRCGGQHRPGCDPHAAGDRQQPWQGGGGSRQVLRIAHAHVGHSSAAAAPFWTAARESLRLLVTAPPLPRRLAIAEAERRGPGPAWTAWRDRELELSRIAPERCWAASARRRRGPAAEAAIMLRARLAKLERFTRRAQQLMSEPLNRIAASDQ